MASLAPPTPAEIAANRGPSVAAAVLVVAILATVAVALRLVARYVQKIGLGTDDILILLALVYLSLSPLVAILTHILL